MQTMRKLLLGPVQKCFSKIYKRIPDSGLGGGIQIVLLSVTHGQGPYRHQQTRRLKKGGEEPWCPGSAAWGLPLKVCIK